jgi:hypothetical protein
MWVKAKGFFDSPDAMLLHKQKAQTDTERYYHINLVEDYFSESYLNVGQKKSAYTKLPVKKYVIMAAKAALL